MTNSAFESIAHARFYQFEKSHTNQFISFLYNERQRRILNMIASEVKKNSRSCFVLDIGCGSGYFSGVLSLQFTTVGLDADRKEMNLDVQRKFKKLNFILADMRFMPFKSYSIDIIVCISVLEHCKDLEDQIRKIKDVLKKDAVFIAGYPIETKFFKSVWKRVSPLSFMFIDCERAYSQPYWRNPSTGKLECYWESFHTHKQTYQKIRKVLGKNFKILHKEKLPFDILPDSLTYYECVKMRNVI